MDNLNLINKNNIDSEASESSDKDVNKLINQEKITRIVFDQNQLNYFKFKLSFKDGFKFGLGLITAYSIVILIIFIFLITLSLKIN